MCRCSTPVNHRGEQLAQALSEVVADVMGTRQLPQFLVRRNAARDAELDPVMRFAAQMGTLALRVEHSFHTQPRIAAWLRSDENLRRLAEAEAALIAEYFGLEAPEERYELLKDVRCPAYRATLEKLARRGLLDGWCGEGESAARLGRGTACGCSRCLTARVFLTLSDERIFRKKRWASDRKPTVLLSDLREPLIQSQRVVSEGFCSRLRFGNRRNPLRISRFSN